MLHAIGVMGEAQEGFSLRIYVGFAVLAADGTYERIEVWRILGSTTSSERERGEVGKNVINLVSAEESVPCLRYPGDEVVDHVEVKLPKLVQLKQVPLEGISFTLDLSVLGDPVPVTTLTHAINRRAGRMKAGEAMFTEAPNGVVFEHRCSACVTSF